MTTECTNEETDMLDSGKEGKKLNSVFVFQSGCAVGQGKRTNGGNSRMTDLFQHILTNQRVSFYLMRYLHTLMAVKQKNPNNLTIFNSGIFVFRYHASMEHFFMICTFTI